MGAKATENFHAIDPEDGQPRFFEVGDRVPNRIAAIARSVVDKPPAVDTDTTEVTMTQAELDQQIRQAIVEAFQTAGHEPPPDPADEGDDTDDDGEGDSPFDPETHTADEVKKHLQAQDADTDTGAAEIDRVTALEKSGKDRSTAYLS